MTEENQAPEGAPEPAETPDAETIEALDRGINSIDEYERFILGRPKTEPIGETIARLRDGDLDTGGNVIELRAETIEAVQRGENPSDGPHVRELPEHSITSGSLGRWLDSGVEVSGVNEAGEPRAEFIEMGPDKDPKSWTQPPMVSGRRATEAKGYPHPGSFASLPGAGFIGDRGANIIHFQFGHAAEVGRNGCFDVDVLKAVAERLGVFANPVHPMFSEAAMAARDHIYAAIGFLGGRREERKARGVADTDKP